MVAQSMESKPWHGLRGKITLEVLAAPKTGGDPQNHGYWPEVPKRIVSYLERNVLLMPWANSVALLAAIMMARRFEVSSVLGKIVILHSRFTSLFPCLGLAGMNEWDASEHIPKYLRAEILPDDPQSVRQRFWVTYSSASKMMAQWLGMLSEHQRSIYQPFTLPTVSRLLVEGLLRQKEVTQQQQRARKAETDAIVPRFAGLRAEAHLRYNLVTRLRSAYLAALRSLQPGTPFPLTFSYEEGEDKERSMPAQERLWFRIWDRRSFVVAHAEAYPYTSVNSARRGVGAFADSLNHPFLEFTRAERLFGDAPAAGLWFEELFKLGVMGLKPIDGSAEEVKAKQTWLASWGYTATPFLAEVAGLLTWPLKDGRFMGLAQRRIKGLLLPVEAIYAASTLGLMAIDLFTTTGARINEIMQIRLTQDCIARLKMPSPPGALDQSPRIRYVLRLIPKGDKRGVPQDYFVGEETKRLLVRVAQMLGDHYQLQHGQVLPSVDFDAQNGRAHRFGKAPYLFQYGHRHLSDVTITSCMRFLLHGMIFKTRDGNPVALKSHLLRHAFATHAVQVEKIPVDIVGAWLHQKNLAITDYYSKPTERMVADAVDFYLSRIAAQVNVDEAVLRSPQELLHLYEGARGKAGTLADVVGGQCVSHGYCAAKFACVGCAGKVPDPAKRHQIEKHKQWASIQVEYAAKEGLYPEAERMKQLVRDCDNELAEMDLIDSYRRDQLHEVHIRIES